MKVDGKSGWSVERRELMCVGLGSREKGSVASEILPRVCCVYQSVCARFRLPFLFDSLCMQAWLL